MARKNQGAGNNKPASAPPAPKPEAEKPKDQGNEGSNKENLNQALPSGKVGLKKFDKFKLGGSHNDK